MIYKLRILLDTDNDVFRDIELQGESTFEDLHYVTLQAFEWNPREMASFYESNENWDKGEEIPLMDVQEEFGPKKLPTMADVKLEEKLEQAGQRMLYVFDFLLMWCFYVEVLEIKEIDKEVEYPIMTMAVGIPPHQMDKEEVSFEGDKNQNEEEGGEEDDFDPNDYSDLDYH